MTYENIIVYTKGRVGVVQLNRPKALNALNAALMEEATTALAEFDANPDVGAIIVTGNERAFAAGADIKAMATSSVVQMLNRKFIGYWDKVKAIKKPVIAAVSGFVLGGGSEFMMLCDMVIASETTKIGQPEINLGIIPGAGGTQRITRAVGKVIAMEICLNSRFLSADEALHYGLINRVVPVETYLDDAIAFAAEIAARAPVALQLGKDAVNSAFELSLTEGVARERMLFSMLFATEDQKEGMDAFINKRKPEWKGK